MRRHIGLFVSALSACGALLVSSQASAKGFESCGNIELSAEAQCTAYVEGGCEAQCQPVTFELSCEAECDGTCSATASGSCTGSCEAECSGQCSANPGSFDCEGYCEGSCSADCSGHCSAAENKAECEGQCKASCSGECQASCNVEPPTAQCDAKCKASCKGKCDFEADAKCNIDCHGGCTSKMQGGCEVQCTEPGGAVFCDGQYVDAGNNAAECFDAIEAAFDIEGYAKGEASCDNGECSAEGEAGVSCSTMPRSAPWNLSAVAAAVAGLGLVVARRRRRS